MLGAHRYYINEFLPPFRMLRLSILGCARAAKIFQYWSITSQRHAHVPVQGEELQAVAAALAARAAVLHATERDAEVAAVPGVDPHRAGLQRGDEAVGVGETDMISLSLNHDDLEKIMRPLRSGTLDQMV